MSDKKVLKSYKQTLNLIGYDESWLLYDCTQVLKKTAIIFFGEHQVSQQADIYIYIYIQFVF